ncbi:MAG: amino acid ABC transporter permease [Clostridia bacterium]|jgi:His/Glu/Gln/Arg/opine family amino acid ABC transporter permease subunit|nr:amino acid ABC transporter permease [Clostridia bacterium]
MSAWLSTLHQTFIETGYWKQMLLGLQNTVIITLGALLIGVLVGALLAVCKFFSEGNKALRPLEIFCDLYTTVIRGIPMMVLLLVFFFVIFSGTRNKLGVCILAFGLNSAAYVAEIIRSGINAVDRGQMEAGRSLGMSKIQAMYKVVFPQAIRNILPAIGNELITLVKETSVAGYVGVMDLTKMGERAKAITFDAVNPLLVVAVTYLIIVIGLTRLLGVAERRLNRDKR